MKNYIMLVMALVFLVSCGPSKIEKAQIEFNEGVKMMYQNKDKRALAHFDEALALNPEMTDAIVYRAKIYMNGGDYTKAVKEATVAIDKNPNHGEAYNTRAQAKFYLRDRDGSCADWIMADELGIPNLENKIRHCK